MMIRLVPTGSEEGQQQQQVAGEEVVEGGLLTCSPLTVVANEPIDLRVPLTRVSRLARASDRIDSFASSTALARFIHSFVHSFICVFISRDAAERAEHLVSSCHSNCFCFFSLFLRLVFNHRQQRLAAGKVPKATDREGEREVEKEREMKR